MKVAVRGRGRLALLLIPVLVACTIVACDLGGLFGGGEAPNVVIERPPNNTEVRLGETIPIRATATDSTGVTRAELWVGDALYAEEVSPVAQGQTSFTVALNWRAEVRGSHRVVVKAYNSAGNVGESAPITLVVVERGPGPQPSPTGPRPSPSGPQPTPSAPQPTPAPPQPTPTQPGPPPPTATTPPQPPTHTPPPTNTAVPGPCVPTVVKTINVGGHPKGVAVHGHRAYVGLHDAPVVVVIDTDTDTKLPQTLDTGASGPNYANGVAFHTGSGRVYVANKSDNTVSAIDPSAPASPKVIAVGSEPFGVATAGQYVYAANFGNDSVSIIDSTTDSVVGSCINGPGVGLREPALLGSLGQYVFVPTNGLGPVLRLGPTCNPAAVSPNRESYLAAAANTNSGRIFVSNRNGKDVTKIYGGSVEGIVNMPHRPYGIAVNSSKGRIYAMAADADLLYVLDGPTMEIVGSVPIGGQGGVEGGQGIALWGNKIYVSNYQDGTVTVLNDAACP
jgi:YVTN family beta-propeller protein